MEAFTTTWMVLFLALLFSIFLTPFSMRLAHKLGAIDAPNGRSVHKAATPRLGGVAIGLSLLFSLAFYLPFDHFSMGFLVGLLIIALTGLVDDIKELSHRFKFVGEIAAAVAFVSISGAELSGLGNLFGFGVVSLGPLSFAVTVFAIVGLINAMNLSDGLDGLAGGLAVIALMFFALLALNSGQHNVLVIALSMAGALIGFLLYNGFPARLFMGDVGSLMIGYTCAALAVRLADHQGAIHIQPITIALILAVPLLDTLVVMAKRMLRGHSPFLPDNTHLHHRLISLGLSQNQAVSVLYALMFLYGTMALIGLQAEAYWLFYAALLLTACVYRVIAVSYESPWRLVALVSRLGQVLEAFEQRQDARLAGLWFSFRQGVPNMVLLLFLLPLFFLRPLELEYLWFLPLMLILLVVMFRHHNARVVALVHALLYLVILSLLFIYHTTLQGSGWSLYWALLIGLSLLWTVLALFIGHMRRLLALHSLEILLILVSWLGVFVLMPMLDQDQTITDMMRLVCVYAIPLLLMAKLSVSVLHQRPAALRGG